MSQPPPPPVIHTVHVCCLFAGCSLFMSLLVNVEERRPEEKAPIMVALTRTPLVPL